MITIHIRLEFQSRWICKFCHERCRQCCCFPTHTLSLRFSLPLSLSLLVTHTHVHTLYLQFSLSLFHTTLSHFFLYLPVSISLSLSPVLYSHISLSRCSISLPFSLIDTLSCFNFFLSLTNLSLTLQCLFSFLSLSPTLFHVTITISLSHYFLFFLTLSYSRNLPSLSPMKSQSV